MQPRHKTLIIGVGSIGERHLRCFGLTGRTDLALAETNAPLRDTIAQRYQVQEAFPTLEAALTCRPKVAVIATPAPFHVAMAQQLVEAGVHLLIEKPLSTSLEGVERLQETARRQKVQVGVAYVHRCHPLLTAMRRAIRDGRFGKPVELVVVSGQHFPLYRPAYREIYYNRHATGGGAIQDALTHLINAGEWLVGPITRLIADAGHQVLEGVAVEDTVHLLARQANVLASYSLNQHQAPNEVSFTVICECGTVRCEYHENRWRWMTQPAGTWEVETMPPLERDTLFLAQAHAFLDAVEGKAEVLCPLSEGLQTLKVNLAALASVQTGQWQELV